jgi:hypothetical protein
LNPLINGFLGLFALRLFPLSFSELNPRALLRAGSLIISLAIVNKARLMKIIYCSESVAP